MDRTPSRRLIEEFVNQRVWAVVGATTTTAKYGHTVFTVLRASGYIVYPVNPRHAEIEGARCYPTVAALPERPGVVDLVVPPAVGLEIVRQCAAAGIERVWLQPGAESPEVIALAEELGLRVVHHACAMANRRRSWA
jgi:predicted CoA-binding protein